MTGPTHLLVGMAVTVPLAAATGQPLIIVAGLVGGLWPDLDASETTLSHWRLKIAGGRGKQSTYIRPFYPLSQLVSSVTKHRSVWHSLPVALITGLIAGVFLGWAVGLGLLLGILSHLILDGMTPSGVDIWPGHRWHVLPEEWRLPTGSLFEHVLSAVAAVFVLIYLFGQLVPMIG